MSVKLSELTASTGITSDDLFLTTNDPGGTPQSRKATAQQVLDYITGSTFNTLTVTNLTGTNSELTGVFSGTFLGDGSALTGIIIPVDNFTLGSTNIILGTTASVIQGLSVITGSTVTGSTALFNNITSSVALFTGDIRVLGTASITQLNTVGQQSLVVGDKYITILSGGVDHTGINGAGFLWGTSSGPGETTGALGEHAHILYDSSRDALEIFPGLYVTGSTTLFGISGTIAQFTTLTGSIVTGSTGLFTTITASNLFISSSGNTIIDVSSNSSALRITQRGTGESIRIEDSTNPDVTPFVVDNNGNVGIGTSLPTQKLEVNGSILIAGPSSKLIAGFGSSNIATISFGATENTGLSSPVANSIAAITSGSERLRITTDGNIGIGKQIPNSLLDIAGNTLISGNLNVTGTLSGTIARFTTISGSTISASNYVGLPTSSGGTPGGTNTTIQFNSGSTFSGSTNLVYNFTTNTLSGTTAQFTNLTSSVVSASTYLGLPFANSTFTPSISADLGPNGSNIRVKGTTYQNTTGRTLSIQIVLNCSTVGTRTAFVNQDFNAVNNGTATVVYSESAEGSRVLTVHFYVPAGHYYKITSDASETIGHWYEYQLFGGGGDVILSASNTFTGVNTFNTNFITASAGITGSVARFTTISGSTISASNYVGLPFANSTFTPVVSVNLGAVGANTRQLATTYQNTTGRTLFLSVGVASSGSNSAYIYAGSDFTSVNNQTIVPVAGATFPSYISGIDLQTFVPPGHYYRVSGEAGVYAANLWYEYELFGGGGDVILSASNTFTGINTFNTNFITASAGITGSIARFTTISGSTISASLFVGPGIGGGGTPGGTNTTIQFNSGSTFSGSTNLVWDYTNNRLGIGTSNPSAPIHSRGVNSSQETLVLETTSSIGSNIISFKNSSTNLGYIGYGGTIDNNLQIGNYATSSGITFWTTGSSAPRARMEIAANGNVGINTNPTQTGYSKFSVRLNTNKVIAFFEDSNSPNYSTVTAWNDAGSSVPLKLAGQILTFTGDGGSGAEHARITSTGNFGIGTTSPATKLDVSGSIRVTGGSIYGQVAEITASVSTTYTLQSSDSGKFLTINNGSPVTLTVPSGLPTGFTVSVCQLGAGQITVSSSGVTINNRQSHTKTAGQYAVVSLVGTSANTYIFGGDTSA